MTLSTRLSDMYVSVFKKYYKIFLCSPDPTFEKHSMHSTDQSSNHGSIIKGDTRTGTYTGTTSDLSPSDDDEDNNEEDDDEYSNEDWESTNVDEELGLRGPRPPYRYSSDVVSERKTPHI